MDRDTFGCEGWERHSLETRTRIGTCGLGATQQVSTSELPPPEVLEWRSELLCARPAWLTDGDEKVQATMVGSNWASPPHPKGGCFLQLVQGIAATL